MKKMLLSLLAAILLGLAIAGPVYATEITPDPDSYSYGSTSEFSSSQSVSADSGDLADTGENTQLMMLVAVAFIVLGTALGIRFASNERTAHQ